MADEKLRDFLDRKVVEYNTPAFIPLDPISIPHLFTKKQDIEIAGFFAALFAWGNRTIIINKCQQLIQLMDNRPYEFCLHHDREGLKRLVGFKHRTFNTTDLLYFVAFFKHHYTHYHSLEEAFIQGMQPEDENVEEGLNYFYHYFFSLPDAPERTKKHIAAPFKNATCKRLNMFLRWMVRNDDKGVDFGIWGKIKPHQLICPVDIHVARVARKLSLVQRKQTDWQAAVELTNRLKRFDREDPVKYDFALFSLGVIEKF
ncbi:MAG: TIGR02757 family protein [Flavisolibacter sp.]|nr:TIGR02757 family protein [Flavisolibacter sp.]